MTLTIVLFLLLFAVIFAKTDITNTLEPAYILPNVSFTTSEMESDY